jgi:cytochrome c-type biogenesis protein CcmE
LVAALGAAIALSGGLVYTSFSAANQVRTPSQIFGAPAGRAYQVTGTVLPGYTRVGDQIDFRIRDRAGAGSIPVRYTGLVPDPFAAGREVIVTVERRGATFVGQPDSLITRCPSKFATAPPRA